MSEGKGFWTILARLYWIFLIGYFIYWYIKMHTHPRWWWAFWICSVVFIWFYQLDVNDIPESTYGHPSFVNTDTRSGNEIWQENMRNY